MLHHSSSGKLIKAARQEAGNCSTQKGDERCNYSKSVGWNQASTCQWTHFLWSARSFTKSRCCSCGICWKKQAFFYCHLKCQFQGLKLMAVGMDLQLFLKCRCLLQSAPVWNPYVSKRLTVAVFDSFRWGFCCEECCIEMHWPFAWSHVGLQFNVVLGVFEVLHFGVRSSELSHFDLQINRKVWDSGKLSHSNQLRLLELLLSSLVMWHVFFFFWQLRTALTICPAQKFLLQLLLARLTPLQFFQISVPSHGRGKMVDLRRGKGFDQTWKMSARWRAKREPSNSQAANRNASPALLGCCWLHSNRTSAKTKLDWIYYFPTWFSDFQALCRHRPIYVLWQASELVDVSWT